IFDLIKKKPAFAQFAESAIAEWTSRIESLDRKIAERDAVKAKKDERVEKGNEELAKIRSFMDQGRVYEASLAIDKFVKEFPTHPDVEQAKAYQAEIEKVVDVTFGSMTSQIETFIKT